MDYDDTIDPATRPFFSLSAMQAAQLLGGNVEDDWAEKGVGSLTGEQYAQIAGGGGGGSGTTNYAVLSNKPKIGGVTLSGDKSLTDLGIASAATVGQISSDVAGMAADVQTAVNKANQAATEVASATQDVTQLETDTAQNTSDIATLQTAQTLMQTSINTATDTATAAKAKADQVASVVDGLSQTITDMPTEALDDTDIAAMW